ncbi:MAG: DUF1016 family protein [Flavobacteriales bacterium]|nr:DUF1016 family protein [Flavobacteriales bacterium]
MKVDREKAYLGLLEDLKQRIASARIRAALAANAELIRLYWDIGKAILKQQEQKGWGAKVTETLSADLRKEFPDMKGLSDSNLRYMRRFAETYPDLFRQQSVGKKTIRQQPVGELSGSTEAVNPNNFDRVVSQLPWGHNIALMNKANNIKERLWYANQCVEYGWSRAILEHQIETGLYQRQERKGKSTNFKHLLPSPQSELAEQTIKDPYVFDFLGLSKKYKEKELEDKLMEHITRFLIELGKGFAFVGRQYHLQVGEDDFYIDLLFYHIRLKSYVVVELKIDKFKPEYAGQLNFYLSAVDDMLKGEDDKPTIGILLCPTKNSVVVEYALKGMSKPMGVSEYQLSKSIPKELKKELRDIDELKQELEEEIRRG